MDNFLLEFKKFWICNNIFEESVVSEFSENENFSNCDFVWINWDKLTNDNYKQFYKEKPKSCDVIKFLKNQIDFIEFKTLNISEIKNINEKINKFELTEKLEKSYELIKFIIKNNSFIFDKKNILIIQIKKLFIVSIFLVWFDSKNKFALANKIKIIQRNIEWYFKANPMPYLENFLDPLFKRTEDMNKHYKIDL